ncbi:MAG: tripartite tricarboxylate transporter substrate binding protein, partial [Betaproteobacteria bacterium]|nr:tripartite tricarboxylate transporter substrate binding protein [Betaproteobacteria bacterium]
MDGHPSGARTPVVARTVVSFLAGIVCMLATGWAQAQDYPFKPIRLIVADSPGASWDIVARLVAPDMFRFIGQPIVVENRPGGSYTIGLGYVANQAPPDGYTIAIAAIPGLAILPLTMKDLRFEPLKDLQSVITLVEGRIVLGTSSQFAWKNFGQLIAQARAAPGKLNYGLSGANSRLQMEAIVRAAGVDIVFVPYKAGAVYLQGLVSGEVQMGILSEVSAGSYGERMRVLAVTGEQRSMHFPDVPTFAEIGRPEI